MALCFDHGGYESLFKKALIDGINLFCGAGFSVEASDANGQKLPVGFQLLDEMKNIFPSIKSYTRLDRACTKITNTQKEEFYSYLKRRFTVNNYNSLYLAILRANINSIYTTNIDDLFFKIYDESDCGVYLHDRSVRGTLYNKEESAVYYNPLHGCVRTNPNYVFGTTEIASAFSQQDMKQSWRSLAKDSAEKPILFWGWNFEDSGPLEAMYRRGNKIDANSERWVLLKDPNEEMEDYLQSLKFNIIIGDTVEMLKYILDNCEDKKIQGANNNQDVHSLSKIDFTEYEIPKNDNNLPSYELRSMFLDYTPHWSHIYSKSVPKTTKYKETLDAIASGQNIIVTGMRGSGKTTIMMQLLFECDPKKYKHLMIAPSVEQAQQYIKLLNGQRSLIFIDDCFRDTDAILTLNNSKNIQVVCSDRDYNYERQFHKIQKCGFRIIDVTEITKEDAQSIIDVIPSDLKKTNCTGTKYFDADPTILGILASNLKPTNFNFLQEFAKKDYDAARVFLMISYVHSCGVPCSFDMVYSFLGDTEYQWKDMYEIVERAGSLVKDVSESFLQYNILEGMQNYYQCRSRYFAEIIIKSIPSGNKMFADVLMDFTNRVGPYKICLYDKFKRNAYDADLAMKAFPSEEEAEEYYNLCAEVDESEYVYQQAAIYFSRKKDYKRAFFWIEKARSLDHYNRFSIQSTYAQIFFDVNLYADENQCILALKQLEECCRNDKRKSIHFDKFALNSIQFYNQYNDSPQAEEFISTALEFVEEGLDDKNLSISNHSRKELRKRHNTLLSILNKIASSQE